jgi:hypothetical protein
MKPSMKLLAFLLVVSALSACVKQMSFQEQIVHDIVSKMNTGICEDIPKGAMLKNVVVGEITPIGDTGLIDVAFEYDLELREGSEPKKGALLYSKTGNVYVLEAIGSCDYKKTN